MRPATGTLARIGSLAIGALLLWPTDLPAWTNDTSLAMAWHGARLAPPDLVRQIERHEARFLQGVVSVEQQGLLARVSGAAPDAETLLRAIDNQVDRAVRSIVEHRPFAEIVFEMGVVARLVGGASNPLLPPSAGATPPLYTADFWRYVDSSRARFAILYYGQGRLIDSPDELAALIRRSLQRGRSLSALIDEEYRRIGVVNGIELFDDRSTAFGVGALAFSHGVSDIAGVLRYIWLRAGGVDRRQFPTLDSDHLILVAQGTPER